jgi:chorismate synthase
MKNTFGSSVCVTLFGESHGTATGVVLDGIAPGIEIKEDFISAFLLRRRPVGDISTARREQDVFQIVSGVFNGKTTGTPICIVIPNNNVRSKDYSFSLPRPGHADLTAQFKYHGFQDYRGGGHFSGRLTAALTAAGAIAVSALKNRGIMIGTHIKKCAGICDDDFTDPASQIPMMQSKGFVVLNNEKGELMQQKIRSASTEKDSVGGILETVVLGVPAGIGEPWFDTVEGALSHMLFSIPAVKGVEFGDGFAFADMRGSDANDPIEYENGKFVTSTNHNGGINGGITNGMPIVFRCCIKPTPSIGQPQKTADLQSGENTVLEISGRHDPAIVHRAATVVDSVTALVLCDLLAQRFGTDWLKGE